MSKLIHLDESNFLDEIPTMFEQYEAKIAKSEALFKLEGRKLESIMRDLPLHQAEYSRLAAELKSLLEILSLYKDKIMARYWKKYLEGYNKSLATRDIQTYIQGEPEVVNIARIEIEIKHLRDNAVEISEALKQMGWQCGNITKLMISDMREAIL